MSHDCVTVTYDITSHLVSKSKNKKSKIKPKIK